MSDLLETARHWVIEHCHASEEGQAMVEYALIFTLIVIACIAIVTSLGDVVVNKLWGLIGTMPFGG
jgi:Flp pilus assembly pilin Flp